MPLTEEQAKIAQAIATETERLVKAGKSQMTIFGEMADYMSGFKSLIDAGVAQEAADQFPGFHHYAKILERTAHLIQTGAIRVPK